MTELFDPNCAGFRLDGDRRDAVVLIHGFTGAPTHFRLLGRYLNERGFTVVAPLLAGHGTSIDDMARTGQADWIESARTAVAEVSDKTRVHLVGLSMGGLIALVLAGPTAASTVTTINSPLRFRDKSVYLTPWLHRFSPRVERPLDEQPPFDSEADGLWLTYGGFPTRAAADLLRLSRRARRAAGRLRRPTLVVQSRADEAVEPRSAELLAAALGPGCRLLWLDRSRHNSLLDVERDIIHAAILDRIT